MKKLITICLISAFGIFGSMAVNGADNKPSPAEKDSGGNKAPRAIPFHGKVDAVDKNANTVKVGDRTFQVTSDTKFIKAGKPATLDDAKAGEEVGGAYREGDGGKLNLVSLRIGPRPEPKPKGDDKK